MTSAEGSNSGCSTVPVSLGSRSYEIVIVTGQLASWAGRLDQWIRKHPQFPADSSSGGKALIVTDAHIGSMHARTAEESLKLAGWKTARVELQPGEQSKTLE